MPAYIDDTAFPYVTTNNVVLNMKTRNVIGILLAFFSVAWSTAAEPENMQQVCDSVVPAALSAMESSTERKGAAGRGTAVAAAIPGYRVACKTTTLKYNEHRFHPTFTNYKEAVVDAGIVLMLPADKPQLLVLLMLKDVRSEQVTPGGGTVAAPMARRIAEQGIKLLNIPPGE